MEEAGLLGSAYFTKSAIFEGKNIVAMLNMDMIGRLADDKLIVYGTSLLPLWTKALDSLNSGYNFKLTFSEEQAGDPIMQASTVRMFLFFTSLPVRTKIITHLLMTLRL